METPSADLIRSYLEPNVFATARSAARGIATTQATAASSATVKAGSMQDSYQLLTGSLERLGTLRSNLRTLQELSFEANQPKVSLQRKEEIYGMMRSLTAGIDILVDETRYKDQKVLDGSDLQVNSGTSATTRLQLDSLRSSDDGGLDLSSKIAGVRTDVFFDASDQANNALAGVLGLDISDSRGITPQPGNLELANGDYSIKVHYAGPNSTVELFTSEGRLLSRAEGVDLSGNGVETVPLESGVELTFAKEQLSEEIDKYDYENNGPAILTAKLRYERVYQHELDDGSGQTRNEAAAELVVSSPQRLSSSGSLDVDTVSLAGLTDPARALETGAYRVEVGYAGANSTATLYDRDGRMVDFLGGLNLEGTGKHAINFDRGFKVTLDNQNFGGGTSQLTAQINLTKADVAHEVFDFSAFAGKVDAALARADAQYDDMEAAQQQIVRIQQAQMGAGSAALNGVTGLSTGQLLSTLLGGSNNSGIQSFAQASAQTNLIGMQILNQANAAILTQTQNLPAEQASGVIAGTLLGGGNSSNPSGGLFGTLLA